MPPFTRIDLDGLKRTQTSLRSVRFIPQFVWWAFRSGVQATRARGNVKATGLQDSRFTFWTLTA
jgi:hypothetical protein